MPKHLIFIMLLFFSACSSISESVIDSNSYFIGDLDSQDDLDQYLLARISHEVDWTIVPNNVVVGLNIVFEDLQKKKKDRPTAFGSPEEYLFVYSANDDVLVISLYARLFRGEDIRSEISPYADQRIFLPIKARGVISLKYTLDTNGKEILSVSEIIQ